MRVVLQRVREARVEVANQVTGEIHHGILVLVGIQRTDSQTDADYLVSKITDLRIFNDEAGKMNLSVRDTGGALLIVSQFTLYADCRKGRRPSYDAAAAPDQARQLYEYFVNKARSTGIRVETGTFQASMSVHLVNDGPVTLILDSV